MNAWQVALLLTALGTAVGVAVGGVALYRLARRTAQAALEQEALARRCRGLERDFAAVLACSRQLGTRLVESERARDALQKQIDKLRLEQQADGDYLPVQHAMKLLDSGVAVEEVIRACELSAGEAQLLHGLARFRSAA